MTGETREGPATAAGPEIGGPAEEARLGGTPGGRAANAALLALSRASRSFLLYDPLNEAIRSFIKDLRFKMYEAFVETGPLALEVRPFEMVLDGEVVYLERDRERSLAFRMFRDGVRRLTIQPDVEWDELLSLLEVLSIRYTGVRQGRGGLSRSHVPRCGSSGSPTARRQPDPCSWT